MCLCILSLDSIGLCMFNVSLCLSVKFKCQTICHLCQHQCPCQIFNNGSIKCIYLILSYLSLASQSGQWDSVSPFDKSCLVIRVVMSPERARDIQLFEWLKCCRCDYRRICRVYAHLTASQNAAVLFSGIC